MERAGATRTGRGGATCRVGIGEGKGCCRKGLISACLPPRGRALRAGVVARARLTEVLWRGFAGALETLLRLDLLVE
jgi:hypothetical protein